MPSLADVAEWVCAFRAGTTPFVVGVTGSVAAGKSTFAAALRETLAGGPDPGRVELVCTDGFLFDNATLAARGLTLRKGFPESYDAEALARTLAAARAGAAEFPGYSHVTYDVDPGLARRIEAPDVLIVEGLGLQDPAAAGLDALIYLDAEEAHLEAWFTDRFMGLWRAAGRDPASFYAAFRRMSPQEARAFAGQVWRGVNLPNLRDHISPARAAADLVVRKGPAHEIAAILTPQEASRSSSSGAMSSLE
jgi:type I pantothenate kinase